MRNIFESINNTSDKAAEVGEKYLRDSHDYYKLKIFQQLTVSVSMIAKALLIGGLLFIGLIFISIAAALALGDLIGNIAVGYLIVAGFFLIAGAVLYSNRRFINHEIIKKMSPKFFNS